MLCDFTDDKFSKSAKLQHRYKNSIFGRRWQFLGLFYRIWAIIFLATGAFCR